MACSGMFFVLFLTLCTVVCSDSSSGGSVRPVVDCSAVSERFMDLFGDYSSSSLPTSSNPVKESNFSVCTTSEESCCTQEMEERFHVESEEELHYQLQEVTSFIGFSLYMNDVQFKNDYTEMLERARLNMEDLFEEDYNRVSGEVSTILTTFFDEAKDFIFMEPGARDIPTFVDDFYDNLFPFIYVEELNHGKIKSGISPSYARCLATNRKTIRPFGNAPKWTKESFENSLVPAKLLLQSTKLGIKVMNTTNHLKLTASCHNALTRMSFCQYCSGYVDLKPCNALCLNVMTGCFAGLYEVDYDWSRFLASLVRLTSSMLLDRDLERVLRNLPKRTINGLNHLRNNKQTILDKANILCGEPEDVLQHFAVKTLQSLSGDRNKENYNDQSMYARINVFSYSLRNSEAFLRSLPNQICFLNKGASDFDARCWTGKRFGNYQKFVWSGGVDQQGRNSEVRLTGREPELKQTEELSEDLQHMRKLILVSLSETEDNEMSGSGSGCYGDEECEEGSGSGAFTTLAAPMVETGAKYVMVTIDAKHEIIATNMPSKDVTTDSDFSFDNTHSQTPSEKVYMTTAKDMTTKHAGGTMRQRTVVRSTDRSPDMATNMSTDRSSDMATKMSTDRTTEIATDIIDVTSKQATEQASTNKFIPTKQVTQRAEVDTQRGTGDGTRLSVVWTLTMAAGCLTLVL